MSFLRAAWNAKELPLVALLGRPNVGKSTLFNRLCRSRKALVKDTPFDHVTRDFREGTAKLVDLRFRVLDTAGLEPYAPTGSIQERGTRLTQEALKRCDLALWLVDARTGITSSDESTLQWLRRHLLGRMPVLTVINKCDKGWEGKGDEEYVHEIASELESRGLEDVVAISAESGQGMVELYQRLVQHIEHVGQGVDEEGEQEEGSLDATPLQLAIVGLPNAGKSTLVNRLLGEERCMTGPEPGITRDSIRARFMYQEKPVWLVDTAGWINRTKAMREGAMTSLSLLGTRRSVRNSHVIALVLDATRDVDRPRRSGILVRSELTLANVAIEEGKPLVVVVNKLDALPSMERKRVTEQIASSVERMLPQVSGLNVVGMSAKTGAGVSQFMPAVFETFEKWNTRLRTAELNQWLLKMATVRGLSSGGRGGFEGRIKYMTQVGVRPPTFVVFTSRGKELEENRLRGLASSIRSAFDLPGVPVRVLARSSSKA